MLDYISDYIGTTKFRIMAIVFIIICLVLLIKWPEKNTTHYHTPEKIKIVIEKLAIDKVKPMSDKLIISCKEGIIKGYITGWITGGFMGGIIGGSLFGVCNPLLLYIND